MSPAKIGSVLLAVFLLHASGAQAQNCNCDIAWQSYQAPFTLYYYIDSSAAGLTAAIESAVDDYNRKFIAMGSGRRIQLGGGTGAVALVVVLKCRDRRSTLHRRQ